MDARKGQRVKKTPLRFVAIAVMLLVIAGGSGLVSFLQPRRPLQGQTELPRTTSSSLRRGPGQPDLLTEKFDCDDFDKWNDSCAYVQTDDCRTPCLLNALTPCSIRSDQDAVFQYLQFHYCTLRAQDNRGLAAFSYILLFIWLCYLLDLSGSTAEEFLVPPLEHLAHTLKLHPAVAGITLLALGNGANDVFGSIAALGAKDFPLAIGGLLGASMCNSALIMGCVLLVARRGVNDVERLSFFRDCGVYMLATVLIIVVISFREIYLWEAVLLLVVYILYVAGVVIYTRCINFRPEAAFNKDRARMVRERAAVDNESKDLEYRTMPQEEQSINAPPSDGQEGAPMEPLVVRRRGSSAAAAHKYDPEYLWGLSWPGDDAAWYVKAQYYLEWPFSLLRWLSIPSSDGKWGRRRRWIAVVSPIGFSQIFYAWVADKGDGYDDDAVIGNDFPIFVLPLFAGLLVAIFVYFTTNNETPPRSYPAFSVISFLGACAWLDVFAEECVAILQSFGVFWNVSTLLLGITVLAIGNCFDDLFSDVAIARAGHPATAIAATFGSPLFNDLVGLGLGLVVATWDSPSSAFTPAAIPSTIKVAWGILLFVLSGTLIVFPVYKFNPPKGYAYYLIILYALFLAFVTMAELNVFRW